MIENQIQNMRKDVKKLDNRIIRIQILMKKVDEVFKIFNLMENIDKND